MIKTENNYVTIFNEYTVPVLLVIVAGLLLPAHQLDSVDCVTDQSSKCVLWCSSGWDGDQCVDTVIDTVIVAGSSGNRCPGHCHSGSFHCSVDALADGREWGPGIS